MEEYTVPAIYIVEDRIKPGREAERLEAMLGKVRSDVMVRISSEGMQEVFAKSLFYDRGRTGQKRSGLPSVVFSGFDWDDPINNPESIRDYSAFVPGRFKFADFRDCGQLRRDRGVVCNSGYEMHTAFGCFHSCDYCHVGNAFTIMLNIEEFFEHIQPLMDANPWQRLYKYDNQSDIFLLEPEYGSSRFLVEQFALTDNYLMLYTKSNNVESILGLEHKGHTVVSFTISPQFAAQKFEHGTPSMLGRVIAAGQCFRAGYPVRVRFSPIIPVNGWQAHAHKMIEMVCAATKPDVVCLEMLCHMDWPTLLSSMDTSVFDKRFLVQGGGSEYELFPHDLRKEVYSFYVSEIRRWNKNVDIALCLETPRMWDELADVISGNPSDFRCCCGAKCVPK